MNLQFLDAAILLNKKKKKTSYSAPQTIYSAVIYLNTYKFS